jgi:NADH-quinone oxidoreductase subunit A
MAGSILPLILFLLASAGLGIGLLVVGRLLGPNHTTPVKEMPYESGMDPIHEASRRFNIRFHLVAIAFLVFDVELLFLYPWAVALKHEEGVQMAVESGMVSGSELVSGRGPILGGVLVFVTLLILGLVYDWRKGLFRWR